MGVRLLAELAGHSRISTTQRYIDVNSDQLTQAAELLESEHANPHFHILLKFPASLRLNSKPDKTYFIKNMVLQLITSLNLVSLHRVNPTHTKTFQVLYDAIGAVGYNLKQSIEQIDFTNIRLASSS